MRLLYIHQYFSTPEGAFSTRSYEFARRLVRAGHEVTILCGSYYLTNTGLSGDFERGIRQGIVDSIHVIEIDLNSSNYDSHLKRSMKFARFAAKVLQVVARQEYDLLYATSTPLTVAIPGILMKLLRIKRKQPFIFEVRDLWPELPREMKTINNKVVLSLLGTLERFAYKYADYGVGLAPGICQGLSRYGTLDADKVTLIPNCCDIEFFKHKVEPTGNEALNQLLANNKVIIFTGAHGEANGLEAVLNVAKYLQKLGRSDIKFAFIGDGKKKPELINTCMTNSIENCYFFDPLPKTSLRYVLKYAALGLMVLKNVEAFYYGTSPNKFFDYIASSLPVVNNYPGWVADLITESECGKTCRPDDIEAFARAILDIVDLSEEQYKCMSDNAFSLATTFDRDIMANKFLNKCENVYAENYC